MLKTIITTAVLAFTMLTSTMAYSGAGHSHGPSVQPTNEQIVSKAFQELVIIVDKSELVEGKTLDKSWKEVTNKKVHNKSLRHYIVSFEHAQDKETLYILLNSQGTYLGANFNGTFEEF
ncbi:DUF6488 family protein [Neptunomonas antarctica]|uniref:DUF3887 domain-containing protein n=1 Tax=Neptunomonas antarctica TaxID=619304 RepID=A0A1N7PB54_9GAMM|nr:DUF6488 family protein [Neptunomonas antarctica]SIT07824.1 hypothetical protein SAMN05421760_113108 [Neptunomonas antarctica]